MCWSFVLVLLSLLLLLLSSVCVCVCATVCAYVSMYVCKYVFMCVYHHNKRTFICLENDWLKGHKLVEKFTLKSGEVKCVFVLI